MSIIRIATQENETEEVLTTSNLVDGEDYKSIIIERVFSAADIGDGTGQTKHVGGCLVGTITSGRVKRIISMLVTEGGLEEDKMITCKFLSGCSIALKDDERSIMLKDSSSELIKHYTSLVIL